MKRNHAPAGTGGEAKSTSDNNSVGVVFKLSDNSAAAIMRWFVSRRA